MPKLLRNTLLSFRDLLATAGPFMLLVLVLLALAYWLLDPTPPKRVVLATGQPQGAYAEFGQRYVEQLKKFGVKVTLRETQGSAENLKLLEDPNSGVDLAFVQGGAGRLRQSDDERLSGLVTLGSLFYEPVWLFYREDSAKRLLHKAQLDGLGELKGWRVSIGAPGSGITNLMYSLFEANGMDSKDLTLSREPQTPAVMGLLAGDLDALVFVSAPESLMVQMLLQTPGIRLLDFAQAEAYARRLPILAPVTLPRGVIDLARDLPPDDVHLIAPTAMLVARESTHPALQQLFVQAAEAIHSPPGWFSHKDEFPTPRHTVLPVSKEAQRFYDSGPPLLQRYLPFWFANLVDRMWVVLVSLIAVLLPLSRVLPPLYELRIRSRIFRWYGRLRQIESDLVHAEQAPGHLLKELDELDARVERIPVPLSHTDELYALRSHIDMVRQRLRDKAQDRTG
ncbi:MAG TPA: TAXI family TRAP transporter solute-binding subunit [Methylibium sp.]